MALNIRVYGLLVNDNDEVLLSDERRFGKEFTKFPGGGLEEGEGVKDCLIREFQEELSLDIEVLDLFYLTDFYQESAFNSKEQLISIYYKVDSLESDRIDSSELPFDFVEDAIESHRWKKIKDLTSEEVTFPIDKIVVRKLIESNLNR
jgi:8-oxo-dGTP pyrophosphatase MutT (NUDIX family)